LTSAVAEQSLIRDVTGIEEVIFLVDENQVDMTYPLIFYPLSEQTRDALVWINH
jgi:hypothetical protein